MQVPLSGRAPGQRPDKRPRWPSRRTFSARSSLISAVRVWRARSSLPSSSTSLLRAVFFRGAALASGRSRSLAKGTSSTGKSFTTSTVLRFFPAEAWLDLGSMSRRFLFYTEEAFAHRFLIVPKWASIKDDEEVVAMLRVLLSEGRLVHGTVEGEGRRKARRIVKEGPTGLIVTTTE